MGLFFQKIILPSIPSLHAGQGLLGNDATYFHTVASDLAETIKSSGWSNWTFWPAAGCSGNVALLAILYVFFGNDPSIIVPVNAAFHATGGILIVLLGRELWPGRSGRLAGIIAGTLFIIFPSSLNWYGQVHKDGYFIVGILTILFTWVRGVQRPATLRNGLWLVLGTIVGMFWVAFVRPYFLKVLLVAGVLLCLVVFLYTFSGKAAGRRWGLFSSYLAALLILYGGAVTIGAGNNIGGKANNYLNNGMGHVNYVEQGWQWQEAAWLPDSLEINLEAAAKIRLAEIQHSLSAKSGSLVDEHIVPNDVWSVFLYMPRALQRGLGAPFPVEWFKELSLTRQVSSLEMAIWYLLAPGVLLAIYYRCNAGLVMAILYALFAIGTQSFVYANNGTLYRMRYGFLFVFVLIGVIGWLQFLAGFFKREDHSVDHQKGKKVESVNSAVSADDSFLTRREAAGAGAAVMIFSLLGYVGFFVRDLLMARWFGAGYELDIFFIGLLLPMFFVSVFSMPLGAALTPVFMKSSWEADSMPEARRLVAETAFAMVCFLGLLCAILFVSAPFILPVLGWSFSADKLAGAYVILKLFLPILFFSGLIIIGNAVLNALGKFLLPCIGQLLVPVAAIAALLVAGNSLGVISVAVGMIIGQIANLVFIVIYLRKDGFTLLPRPASNIGFLAPVIRQYFPLVAAALFTGIAIPIDNSMASILPEGSVAVLGLGMKVVMFLTGLIGAGITAVMIPYFSSLLVKENLVEARSELLFFLGTANLFTIPVSILFYLLAGFIIDLIFGGGAIGGGDAAAITAVMRFGIIQLPFFTTGMLLMRYVTASRRAGLVLVSSLIGICINVTFNYILMQIMGVAGIALATTIAMAAATFFLLVFMRKLQNFRLADVSFLFLGWLLYITFITCWYFASYLGGVVTLPALAVLFVIQWRSFTMRQDVFSPENISAGSVSR